MCGLWIILRHGDPAYEIGDEPGDWRKDRGQKPQNPDQGDIDIKISGNPGTNAGNPGPFNRTAQAWPLTVRILNRLNRLPGRTAYGTIPRDIFQLPSTMSAVHVPPFDY